MSLSTGLSNDLFPYAYLADTGLTESHSIEQVMKKGPLY